MAVTLGVGLAAVNTGNNLLYLVLGLMLSLLLVSGTLSDLALWKVKLKRRVPRRAFVGAPVLIELEATNSKRRLPSYSLEVEDRGLGEKSAARRCFFLKLGPTVTQRGTYRRTPSQRGLFRFDKFIIRTRFPFGLIEKGRFVSAEAEMLVYPRLIGLDQRWPTEDVNGDDTTTQWIGRGSEVEGVRLYRDGDEARAIHWLRSATIDDLVIRERARDARARVSIVLDQREPQEVTDQWRAMFELAVSRAASLAADALQRGSAVQVVARGEASPVVLAGSPPDPIWRFLALLQTRSWDDTAEIDSPPGDVIEVSGAA